MDKFIRTEKITDVKIAKGKNGIYKVVIYTDEGEIVIAKPMPVVKNKFKKD